MFQLMCVVADLLESTTTGKQCCCFILLYVKIEDMFSCVEKTRLSSKDEFFLQNIYFSQSSFVWVQYQRVTDGETDRRTDGIAVAITA